MFSYVPERLAPAAALVVVLHGCKQRAADFARDAGWLALADDAKVALLLPEQRGLPRLFPRRLCAARGWSRAGAPTTRMAASTGFSRKTMRATSGEALSIRQMIDTMIGRHSLDRSRVFIAGFSAGGAMTAVMLAAYPELFAGGAIVAGVLVSMRRRRVRGVALHESRRRPFAGGVAAQGPRPASGGFRRSRSGKADADTRVVPDKPARARRAMDGLARHRGRVRAAPSPEPDA